MKRLMYIATLVLCLGYTQLQSQNKDVSKVLEKVTAFYNSQDAYQVDMVFTMHRGLSGNNPAQSYKGTMSKNGTFITTETLGTKVYQFPKAKIAIDETNKVLTYTPLEAQENQLAPIDLSVLFEYFDQSQLVDKDSYWLCELISKPTNFSQVPYGKVDLYIDKKTNKVIKQVLFFTDLVPFKSKDGSTPESDYGRLVIELTHRTETSVPKKKLTDFITQSTNQKIRLQQAYTGYHLVDQTKNN